MEGGGGEINKQFAHINAKIREVLVLNTASLIHVIAASDAYVYYKTPTNLIYFCHFIYKKNFRWDRGDIQLQAGRPWCLCSARGNSGSPGTGGVKGCTQSGGGFWGRRMILMKACVESTQGRFRRHHICVGIILDTNIYTFLYIAIWHSLKFY